MNNKKGWDLLLRSIEKKTPKNTPPRKNKKPEKEVEQEVLEWAERQNIYLHVIEAKAVFSASAGRYLSGQCESGMPDLIGNNNSGQSLYIELKAKGRRSNLSLDQYQFLKNKIDQNCFAVVVDSAHCLNEFYYTWLNSKNKSGFLSSVLPVPSQIKKMEQNDPELGF